MDSKIKYKEGKFKERGSNMEALTNVLENFLIDVYKRQTYYCERVMS